MNTTQPQQKPNAFSSFRRRIIATYVVILLAGVAAYSHYRHPLLLPATIFINFIIRHMITPVFPRPSDRSNLVLLVSVILFGVAIFTVEPPLRDVLLAVSLVPGVCAVAYFEYRLWHAEAPTTRDA